MRRLTETTLWDNPWYASLDLAEKSAWRYLCDRCNNAGVWVPNIPLATIHIFGEKSLQPDKSEIYRLDWELFLEKCEGRIEMCKENGWWIVEFIPFQCGCALSANKNNKPHSKIIQLLRKYNLLKRFEAVEKRVWGYSEFLDGVNPTDLAAEERDDDTKEHDNQAAELKFNNTPDVRISQAREVLDAINRISKRTGNRLLGDAHIKTISAALKRGKYPIDEVIKTLERQWKLWEGTEYVEYFTPTTLFRPSKWDTYYDKRNDTLTTQRQNAGATEPEQHKQF